jgi:hypothetical protein
VFLRVTNLRPKLRQLAGRQGAIRAFIVGRRSELRYPPNLSDKKVVPPYPFEKISYKVKKIKQNLQKITKIAKNRLKKVKKRLKQVKKDSKCSLSDC